MTVWHSLLVVAALATMPPSQGEPALTHREDRVVRLSGGRIIALNCAGRGKFTVLLEPGDGGRRTHMASLFVALSDRYRVCAYDRRNVGASSAASLPRHPRRFAGWAAQCQGTVLSQRTGQQLRRTGSMNEWRKFGRAIRRRNARSSVELTIRPRCVPKMVAASQRLSVHSVPLRCRLPVSL